MRMINTVSQEVAWLHKDTTMFHVQKSMKQSQEKSAGIATRDGNELECWGYDRYEITGSPRIVLMLGQRETSIMED